MSKSTVVKLFSNNNEQHIAESQAIQEARALIEAEMQADLSAQARARLSEHARLLAQSRASKEMELAARLKVKCQEETRLAEIAQANLEAAEKATLAVQEKLGLELQFQAQNQVRLSAEQQANAELMQRLQHEQNARDAAEAMFKAERELAALKELEWKIKLDGQLEAEENLRLLQHAVAELVLSGEQVGAEHTAADQMIMSQAEARLKLASQLRDVAGQRVDAEQVEEQTPNVHSDMLALSESEARLVSYHEAELAALLRSAANRAAEKFSIHRKLLEEQVRADAEVCERNERLAFEAAKQRTDQAKEMARVEAERKLKAEIDAAAILLSQADTDKKISQHQEETNALLRQAELMAKERLTIETMAGQAAALRVQVERDLASLAEQSAAADLEVAYEVELKLQAEAKNFATVNERIALEHQARCAVEKNIEIEALAIAEVEARMAAELRATESGNERIELEVRAREIAESTEMLNQQAVLAARDLKKTATRVLNMAKVRAKTEREALKMEEEKINAEVLATVEFRKRIDAAKAARDEAITRAKNMDKLRINDAVKAAKSAKFAAAQHVQIESGLLELEWHDFDREPELPTQLSQHQTLEAEQAAMHRAQDIIETARRPSQEVDVAIEDFIGLRSAEEQRATMEEQTKLEAEHRLLNECWTYAGRPQKIAKNRIAS